MTQPAKLLTSPPAALPSVLDSEISLAQRLFWICIFLQLLIWTCLPALLVQGTYVDVLENWEWGRHFQWGYDKDPFFAAWLTYWLLHWTKGAIWTTYLLSQISVVTGFVAVWQLAKRILPPFHALISVTLLSSIFFYHIGATELNDDVLQIGLWALTILFFYDAILQQKYYQWLLVGLCAALASMDKYFTLMLLLPMFTFLLANQTARRSFRNGSFYLGLFLFLLLVIPNFIWLIKHSFVAIQYAFDSASFKPKLFGNVLNHFLNPLIFIISMGAVALFCAVILWGCFRNKTKAVLAVPAFEKQFLWFMFLGPFLYVLLFLILTGAKFRFVWATPLFNLLGIMLVLWLKPVVTRDKLPRYFISLAGVFVLWILIYIGNETISPFFRHDLRHRFEFYPGNAIAMTLNNAWQERYHNKLPYVAGDREIAVYITFYSPDHPEGYFEWNPAASQWIDERELKKQGALFVWNNGDKKTVVLDPAILARFPKATETEIYRFNWAFSRWITRFWHLPEPQPLQLGVAFLPPQKHG